MPLAIEFTNIVTCVTTRCKVYSNEGVISHWYPKVLKPPNRFLQIEDPTT